MSVITMPAAVVAWLGGQTYGQVRYDLEDRSDVTGGAFAMLQSPPRWSMSLRSTQALRLDVAGEWEAMLLRLRGGINHLAIYDVLRPAPLGTMRGNPYLPADAAIGATSLTLDNAIGTVAPGDWFGLGAGLGSSQLVKCVTSAAAAVASPGAFSWTLSAAAFSWTLGGSPFVWSLPGGALTLTFEPPLRIALPAYTAVIWDKPVGYYKLVNSSVTWQARANGPAIDSFSADLLEQWA